LWSKLNSQDFVAGLGALTGNQAIQEVEAGLDAIYLSGWQVAADVAGKCTLTNLYILRTAFH
jgi:isocitrate lyase